LPTPDDRASILKALSANVNLSSDVNVEELAKSKRADGFSGADCAALLREAGLAVLRDHALDRIRRRENNSGGDGDKKPLQITRKHFDYAFDHVMPSVSKADQKKYDKMRDQMARARSRSRASLNMEKEEDGDSSIIGTSHIDNNQDRNTS
jgi:ribosome biogenesis ATPase